MKRISLFALMGLMTAFTASSQTFQWMTSNIIETNLDQNTTVQLPMYQTAVGTDTVTLGIEVIYNDIPATWDGMLCIYGTCLGIIPDVGVTAEMTPISGTDEGMVRLTVNPINGTEVATFQVYVFDIDFPNDGDTATFLLNTTLSIDEANLLASELKMYPNPTNGGLNLNSPSGLNQTSVYSVSGLLMANYALNNELNSTLNLENLPAGVYMIHIEDNEGNSVVKRFIRK